MPIATAVMPTPLELEHAIERLPAEQRARFRWAPERFRQVLGKLLAEETTPELIDRVTVEFSMSCLPLMGDLLRVSTFENVLKETIPSLDDQLDRLKDYFRGSPAEEGVEWAFRALILFLEKAPELAQSELSAGNVMNLTQEMDETRLREDLKSPVSGLLKAQVVLFSLLHSMDAGLPSNRMERLAEYAYLEATRGVNLFSTQGINLDPLKHLTPDQRFEKTLRYIDDLQKVFTSDDVDAISQARVTSL